MPSLGAQAVDAPQPATGTAASPTVELERLADLRTNGAIDQREFDLLEARVVGSGVGAPRRARPAEGLRLETARRGRPGPDGPVVGAALLP